GVCTYSNTQTDLQIVSDGFGGAIITWDDYRQGDNYDIYVQRINSSGSVQWATNGVPICNLKKNQVIPDIISDGLGGAIITWYDNRSLDYDIYVQHINSAGVVQWGPNGTAICTAVGEQTFPEIISDGLGGAIITWRDYRNGNDFDIYAQRINSAGVIQWALNGTSICTTTGHQLYPQIVSDGLGGAIITWFDNRTSDYDIYAQRINSQGIAQWTANGIIICNAAGNQYYPKTSEDGSNGALISWEDYRGGTNSDCYVQRVSATGVIQWNLNGVAACTALGDQRKFRMVNDGSGGVIVAWEDYRAGIFFSDIYAQRIGTSAAPGPSDDDDDDDDDNDDSTEENGLTIPGFNLNIIYLTLALISIILIENTRKKLINKHR
ncbi:MAG: hypothetical protein ACTSQS_18065, partial [Promethearchaeota archaeon]